MNKDIIKKLEKQLLQLKNSKSNYQTFLENFEKMINDDDLLNWIEETYRID